MTRCLAAAVSRDAVSFFVLFRCDLLFFSLLPATRRLFRGSPFFNARSDVFTRFPIDLIRILPGFTGFHWIWPRFTGFTGFYRVLPRFNRFYWVLPGIYISISYRITFEFHFSRVLCLISIFFQWNQMAPFLVWSNFGVSDDHDSAFHKRRFFFVGFFCSFFFFFFIHFHRETAVTGQNVLSVCSVPKHPPPFLFQPRPAALERADRIFFSNFLLRQLLGEKKQLGNDVS